MLFDPNCKSPLPPKYLALAASLLRLASAQFASNVCNDFDRPADWSQEEWDKLRLEMYTRNGDPENYIPGEDWSYDWWLMHHFAYLLKEAAAN